MTVAAAGSSASMRAKVARGSRAMASWSVTYGITEEQSPTPIPQRSHTGWMKESAAGTIPNGVATRAAMSMDRPSWSIPLIGDAGESPPPAPVFAMRWPSITYSMKPMQLANAKTKPSGWLDSRTAVRTNTPPTARTRASTFRRVRAPAGGRPDRRPRCRDDPPADGQAQGQHVPARPRAGRGQDDGAQELNRPDRRQRQAIDGQGEQGVHRGQHHAQREEHEALGPVCGPQDAPWATP